ncbi:MAG: reverse transcriptase family protein [Nitrosopumilus sp.]|nr:reverse transcriptase family protein [Nitrosopumilus sp.]
MDKLSEVNSNLLTVQIIYPEVTIRIILLHGPQEGDQMEERLEFYESVAVEIERCRVSEEIPIILGDLNAKIEKHNEGVKACSANGFRLKEVIENYDLKVVNFHEKTDGKWTRILKNKKDISKSILDYILLDKQHYTQVKEMIIDEERFFTPYRITKRLGKRKITFTDHSAMLVAMNLSKGVMKKEAGMKSTKIWNFTKKGYEKYKELSKEKIDIDSTTTINRIYREWKGKVVHLLKKCFSKKTVKDGQKHCGNPKRNETKRKVIDILREVAKKGSIQRKVARSYMGKVLEMDVRRSEKLRERRLRETLSALSDDDRFSQTGYWKLKNATAKNKYKTIPSSIIRSDNVEVFGEALIKNEFQKEFQFRLRNRAPDEEWKGYTNNINEIVNILAETPVEEGPKFTTAELKQVIRKLKRGKSPGVDGLPAELFIEAGEGLLNSLLTIMNVVKRSKQIPDEWNAVKIVTIYKSKGSKKELINYRGIFLTVVVSKIFEGLVKGRMTDSLKNVDLHQAGSRPNRSAADNLFLLRGCIDHHRYKNSTLYITTYDFEQAFDSLWLQDSIMSLMKIGVEMDMLKLIYKLNRHAKFVVKTPCGETDAVEISDIVEQGTLLGPTLCSSSTGEYCGTNKGVAIGTAQISSLVYVDDTLDVSDSKEDAEVSHENAIIFGKQKKLRYSTKKCKTMVIYPKKCSSPPKLYIDDQKIEEVATMKYLGDTFNNKGNNTHLIEERNSGNDTDRSSDERKPSRIAHS